MAIVLCQSRAFSDLPKCNAEGGTGGATEAQDTTHAAHPPLRVSEGQIYIKGVPVLEGSSCTSCYVKLKEHLFKHRETVKGS